MEPSGLQRFLLAMLAAVALFLLTGHIHFDSLRLRGRVHVDSAASGRAHRFDVFHANYSELINIKPNIPSPRRRSRDASEKPLTEEQKQATFQRYRCLGQRLLKDLQNPDKAKQTTFTNFSDPDSWGWRVNTGFAGMGPEWYTGILGPSFDAIGASKDSPPTVEYTQNWEESADGKVPDDHPLPKLGQWSDVVYLIWESITDQHNRSGLKHIFRENIVNQESCAVGKIGARSKGIASGVMKSYPGLKFMRSKNSAEQDAFEALVGSPNVNGSAWLFIQHAEALGHKTIESITVWDPTPGRDRPSNPYFNKISESLNMWIEMAPLADVKERRRARL
ncbi:hypothetical protein B0A48_16092 [Cryoendolithus antarcticus]|uniref:Uncharacterized protein n=1 Tax=Cryoendolithus antarcticus TaxID=1507870 RepID=A0A1V8SG01_9PEZI|nr:hypothetical protein B0A48_16092 [Cryoendolithus antarcticus]